VDLAMARPKRWGRTYRCSARYPQRQAQRPWRAWRSWHYELLFGEVAFAIHGPLQRRIVAAGPEVQTALHEHAVLHREEGDHMIRARVVGAQQGEFTGDGLSMDLLGKLQADTLGGELDTYGCGERVGPCG